MISVIIPTCNRNKLLSQCLELFRPGGQSVDADAYEVIVTDDSKEGVAEDIIKTNFAWAKWLKGPGKGPAANRNNGAKYAKGDWFVFVDDDCLPDKELIKEYCAGIKNNSGCQAFEGAIYPDSWELLKKDMAECPVNTEGGCFWSANICVNAKLFKQLNGFDERYLIAAQEDQQLKIDIEKINGKQIIFLSEAKVIHPVRLSNLKKKILDIPLASRNFCLYAYKNKKNLGCTSLMKFFIYQMHIHSKNLWQSLKQKKIKSSAVAFVFLVYAVPLNLINFYSFSTSSTSPD